MSDEGRSEAVLEDEEDCGYSWGWHDEHWCEEPKSHPLQQHFCPCGEERDLDTDREEEDRDAQAEAEA